MDKQALLMVAMEAVDDMDSVVGRLDEQTSEAIGELLVRTLQRFYVVAGRAYLDGRNVTSELRYLLQEYQNYLHYGQPKA